MFKPDTENEEDGRVRRHMSQNSSAKQSFESATLFEG
jgi:hypothetical protein